MKRQFCTVLLCLCMLLTLLPSAALAAEVSKNEYGFSTETPAGFDPHGDEHPFGNRGSEDLVNLMPVKELGVFLTTNKSSFVYNFDTSMVNKVFSGSSYYYSGDSFTANHNAAARWSSGNSYRYAAGTVIDAKGSGRPDCIVYYGPRTDLSRLDIEVRDMESGTNTYSIGGAYTWMKGATRYNAESFVSVVGGDFDGSGKETFVLYDPDYEKINLREYRYDTTDSGSIRFVDSYSLGNDSTLATYFKNNKDKEHSLNTIQAFDGKDNIERNTAAVHLAAGDLNEDGRDELVVTVSLGNMFNEGTNWEKGSVVMVLSKGDSGWTRVWSEQLNNVDIGNPNSRNDDEGWHMRAAASAVGDIDGDGKNEIFTVGLASDDNNDDDNFKTGGYAAVITKYTDSGYRIASGDGYGQKGYWLAPDSGCDYVGSDTEGLGSMHPVSVGLVRLDGVGTQPYAFVRGQLFRFNAAGFTSVSIKDNSQDDLMRGQKIIRQPVVGNFDGNIAGREQIFFAMSTGGDNNVTLGGYYYAPTDDGQGPRDENNTYIGKVALDDAGGLRSCKWKLNGGDMNISHAVLTAPDADKNDGMIARYESAEYLFNAPEIMAILEAVPYFEDLKDEYPETLGSTAFGSSKTTGSSTSESSVNRAGAYVAFEQDISALGMVDIASVEFEVAYESEWNDTWEVSTEFETAIDFDAGRESNQVVMMCVPVIVYNYKVWDQGKESSMSITRAQRPSYLTMSVEEYNEIAKAIGDPVIDTGMISAVPGQPDTYPSSADDLQGTKVVRYGTPVITTNGSTVVTQSLSWSNSTNFTTEHTHSIDLKGGAGALGLTIGGSYGHSWGSATSTSDTKGVSRSGSVANIPNGYPDYGFTWEFATWDTTIGFGTKAYQVPVLGYLVSDVRQPPSVPQNLKATPDTRKVTLSWEHGFNSAAGYEICYYLPNNPSGKIYYPLATVDGSNDSYIDTGLEPRTAYQYVVRAIGADGKVSNYTEPVMVVTASETGNLPTIFSHPVDLFTQVGKTVCFSVEAEPAGQRGLEFTWQSRSANGSVWNNIDNSNTSTLEIKNVTAAMDKTRYRCMVSELDSSTNTVFVYSDTATLSVGKADSTTTLSLNTDSGTVAYDKTTGEYTAFYEYTPKQETIDSTEYGEYENTYTGARKAGSNIYYNTSNAYYLKAGTEDIPALGTQLSALGDWLLNSNTGMIAARRRMELAVEQIYNAEGTSPEAYEVFSATVLRNGAAEPENTLVYRKADKHYLADEKTFGEGEDAETRLVLGEELSAEGAELTNANTYLASTLTRVQTGVSVTVAGDTDEDGKATYLIYNAYNLEGDSDIIYEKDGHYYTQTGTDFIETDTVYISTQGLYGTVEDGTGVVSNLVQVGAPVMTQKETQVPKYETIAGDAVTLTAEVDEVSVGSTVTFRFTNTTTGAIISEEPQPVNQTTKKATLIWTPPAAGIYQIVAGYSGGDNTRPSVSTPVTYYAYYAQENPDDKSGYAIKLADTLLYGENANPILNKWTKMDNTISPAPILTASFTAYLYVNGAYMETGTDLPSATLFPGQYRVDAVVSDAEGGEAVVASKQLTVEKCPVTVTAPTPIPINASDAFDPTAYTDDIIYSPSIEGYADLFTLIGAEDVSKGGSYDIQVAYKDSTDESQKDEFLSRYIPTFTKSVLKVSVGTHTVSYSTGSNGALNGYDVNANFKPFQTGAQIAQNHKLRFRAVPDSGFKVSHWTVNIDGQRAPESDYSIVDNVLTVTALSGALDVQVKFTNQFHTVSFGVDGSGGTLTAIQNGITLTTPVDVASGSSVTFTAKPDEGQVVREWKIDNEVVMKNGAVFSGTTLSLENISKKADVHVSFENTATYDVTYSAVDSSGKSVAGVTMTSEGLTDGQATKGSTVTLTASCITGIAIQEWQVRQENDTWEPVAASQPVYTIWNLQQNTDIRVLVSEAQTHDLTWNIIMQDGSEVPTDASASLKATSNGQSLTSGKQSAYIPVDFALVLDDAYYVVGWSENVTQNASDPKQASLASLTNNTAVTVTIAPVGTQITYTVTGASDKADLSAVFTTSGSTQAMPFASGNTPAADGILALTVQDLTEGYEVEGWYVNSVKVEGEADATYRYSAIRNVGAEISVKIVRSSYTVTFSAENGTVSAQAGSIGSGDAVAGDTDVTFTAKPKSATGYNFEGWYVNGVKQAETDPTLTLTVTEATVVNAVYSLIETMYEITYGVVDTNGGTEDGFNGTLNGVTAGSVSVNAGSSFSFTAVPAAGYLVEGWYSDSDGRTSISAAAYEQTSYTVDSVTAPQTVYVKFAPLPTYTITVDVIANGSVTASVNGQTVEISGGALTVSRHDNVVLTAAPASYHRLEKWTLDNMEQGNALTLTLNDVTVAHTVSAVFAASQMIELKTQLGDGGSLTTRVDGSVKDASAGIRIATGQSAEITAVPDTGKMVKSWTVNGVEQDNLSNVLSLPNLSRNTVAAVTFEDLVLHSIPADAPAEYTVTNITKAPSDYGQARQIRDRGNVSFTVVPAFGKSITAMTAEGGTAQRNSDGSWTVTAENVTKDITLDLTVADGIVLTIQAQNGTVTVKAEDGSVLDTGAVVRFGDTITITANANSGYRLDSLSVNGNAVAGGESYTVSSTDTAVNIIAAFALLPTGGGGGGNTVRPLTLVERINAADEGDTVEAELDPDNAILDVDVFEALRGRDVTLQISVGDVLWTIMGTDIHDEAVLKRLNLDTKVGVKNIPDSLVQKLAGDKKTVQLSIAHEGMFGFPATLTLKLGQENTGKYASIYKHLTDGGNLMLRISTLIDADGLARFVFNSASDYVVVLSDISEENPFTDVAQNAYYDAVLWAESLGVTSGTGPDTFNPENGCTRAQAVTFLWRTAGSPVVDYDMPFTDVPADTYYTEAVRWAVSVGVTSGTSDTTFSPDDTCTRAQIVAFLYRFADSPEVNTMYNGFDDVAHDAYYADAVIWAAEQKVTLGTSAARFSPDDKCTRGQIASFLYRYFVK